MIEQNERPWAKAKGTIPRDNTYQYPF